MKKICAVLVSCLILFSDGVIIPLPPSPDRYLPVEEHLVSIKIYNDIASVEIEETFYNPYKFRIEGYYIFPLPTTSSPSSFSLYLNGKELKGEILEKEEARRLYEKLVRQMKDPALLEYYEDNLFKAKIFPILPEEKVKVKLRYEYPLSKRGDFYFLRYPLKIERTSPQPIKKCLINFEIQSNLPVKQVFSPSHEIDLFKNGRRVYGAFEARDYVPDRDFLLYYSLSQKDYHISLLPFKQRGEDGYFLLSLAPPLKTKRGRAIPKDVIFLIDVSGSMSGKKIEEAKKGLKFFLEHLNPGDRFEIIAFSTGVRLFSQGLKKVSKKSLKEAEAFIKDLQALGGTNIYDAIEKAFEISARNGHKSYIVFLTDGQPTVGKTSEKEIIDLIEKTLKEEKIFVFGVGYDVNTVLLDEMAKRGAGTVEYLEPEENLELALSSFLMKINYPALEKILLKFEGVEVYDLHPAKIPALFYGESLLIAGRYRESGKGKIILSGIGRSGRVERSATFLFPEESLQFEFVPLIWARKRISFLLSQIRFHGEKKELVDEIIKLGKRFGIVTPYTSFLISEEERLKTLLSVSPQILRKAKSGSLAFQISKVMQDLARKIAFREKGFSSIRRVADKVFLLKGDTYVDSLYREDLKTVTLSFGSEDYFAFLNQHPEWAKYFSMAKKLIVVLEGTAYKVEEEE